MLTYLPIKSVVAITLLMSASAFASPIFTVGNLVVSVEGAGLTGGSYTDNQAAPLSLFQYSPNGTNNPASFVNSLVLPQMTVGANFAVSGEYGSSSEGTLQLSGNGKYLTIMGYGVNAAAFDASPGTYGASPSNALGQSGSLTGQSYTAVPRVVALIDANGNVNSSTALFNIFNTNNPRSAYTADGTSIYVSGQGAGGDTTGGVFHTTVGSTSATSITGNDAGGGTSQDTRDVQIVNGTLYVSTDSKSGSTNRDFIGTLGTAGNPPTGVANGSNGPTLTIGTTATGKLTITAANCNGVNCGVTQVNLSPENYFFANASTVYVADSGSPKNDSGNSGLGDGGLQKWVNSKADGSGTWTLEYTLSANLNLVANTNSAGTTGLYGLTGEVIGGQVELFATNFTIGDLDPTFLYGITDTLSATSGAGESFTQLAAAPADSNFKGVSFAPSVITPEPASFLLIGLGLAGVLVKRRT